MTTIHPATRPPAEHAPRARGLPQYPSRVDWRPVHLAIAVAGTMAFIIISGAFNAVPEMASSDRWRFVAEIIAVEFTSVGLQLGVLNRVALEDSAPLALRSLRFACMVLLGAVGGAAALILLEDAPSIRLGLVESKTTGAWASLFNALLTATFLIYEHGGHARSEEASRRLKRLQSEQRTARRRLVEAQLQAMQARVDPQMFFDVLDDVQHLYATDPPRAEALLDELIVFLRAALPRLRSASSTLGQELELAASYFRLQTLCGSGTTALRIGLPDALAARAFPAGVILPLLSNLQGAAIAVEARLELGNDGITVSLYSRRVPAPPVLAQARATLEALYGSSATLECHEATAERPIETRIALAHAAS